MLCIFIPHTFKSYYVPDTAKTPLPEGAGYQPIRGMGQGSPPVTSRTSFRTSTIRNQCRSWGKPSSSALRSCRATFFLQDSCRLKYFTSLLCGETQRTEDTSQRYYRRRTGRYLPSVPSHPEAQRPRVPCRNRTFCPSWKTSLHNAQSLSRLRSLLPTAKANPISVIIYFQPVLFEGRLPPSGLLPVTS